MIQRLLTYLLLVVFAANVIADNVSCPDKTTLSFGMVPVTSSNLTEVWASKFNREIQKNACLNLSFGSAPNFKQYIEKAERGSFDVLAVPAHLASYLIKTVEYEPVAFLVWESSYLYVVPNESSITSFDQIGGSSIVLPDPLAEVSILAQNEISEVHSSVSFKHKKNFNQIFSALLNDKADVGVVLSPFYNAYKKRRDIKVRVIHEASFPSNGMLLAAPHTRKHDQEALFKALAALEPNAVLFWQSFESASQADIEKLHVEQAESVAALKALMGKKVVVKK